MASDKVLRVTISAKDGASAVFAKVSDSAGTVGEVLEKSGEQGAQGLKKVSTEANATKVSMRDLSLAATALGAGLTYAGNEALKQQQLILGLQKAFGDAADDYIAFADTIASHSIFNDDDIMRGQRYFATLKNNYDLTDQQIRQLMETTADLASAYGVSFEDASSRITSAIRGEGEAAEYLGLTMNQQSIDRENLTLTMTNQEAAQFRLNALYQQSGVYAGAARELAESEVGTRAKLTNAIQDNAQALGNFLGPITSMTIGAGLASSGLANMFGVVSRGVGTVRASTTAMSALSLAVNPLTLGVAGLAVGAGVLWNQFERGREATKSLDQAMQSLLTTEQQLRLDHEDAAAASAKTFRLQAEGVAEIAAAYHDNRDKILADANRIAEETGKAPGMVLKDLNEQYSRTTDEALAFAKAQDAIGAAFKDQRIDQAALTTALDTLHEQFVTHQITLDEYDAGVIKIANSLADFRTNAEAATHSATGFAAALGLLKEQGKGWMDTLLAINDITDDDSFGERLMKTLGLDASQRGQLDSVFATIREGLTPLVDMPGPGSSQQDWIDWVNEAGISQAEHVRRINAANEARREEAATADAAAAKEAQLANIIDASNVATAAGKQHILDRNAAIVAASEAYDDYIQKQTEYIEQLRELAGMSDPLSMSSTVSGLVATADAASDAAASLETVFRVVVGNTNAIGSQVDSVEKWALELINVRGEYGKIDDLLAAGTITLGQYNAAQDAQETISAANLAIQQDILTIQAKQAPLIAEHTEALQKQMGVIANMPAEQALVSLGWMDATEAGRAFEFQQLAIKAASGEMGAAGAEAFESYITGAAQADPVLKEMLLDMGLIEEKSNGELRLNTDGLQDAKSDVMQLHDTVADLIDVLDDGLLNKSYRLDIEGQEDAEAAKQSILDLVNAPDKKDFSINLTMPGGMGGVAGQAGDMLDRLLGRDSGDDAGVSVPITLDVNDDALDALRNLPPITQEVEFVSAAGTVGAAFGAGGTGMGESISIEVNAVDNASAVIGRAVTFAHSVDGYVTTMDVQAVDNASPTIGRVVTFMSSVDQYTSTMMLEAVDNASPVIGDVIRFMSSVDGYTATMYLNTVTSRTSSNRHGGIAGYAHGGVIAELAEAGPELLHFANGGTMPIWDRGIYSIPDRAYVSPSNTNSTSNYGGTSVVIENITVHGDNAAEIHRVLNDEFTPNLVRVINDQRRSLPS